MRRMLVAAASAALLLASGLASAETVTGRVVTKDATADTLTIQTDAGQQVVLQTGDATIRAQGSDVGLDRLQVGDQVRVETDETAAAQAGQRVASSVEVTTAAGAAEAERPIAGETAETETDRPMAADEMEGTAETDRPMAADEPAERRMARLPDTAGPLPLIGVAGAAALLAGLVLRARR